MWNSAATIHFALPKCIMQKFPPSPFDTRLRRVGTLTGAVGDRWESGPTSHGPFSFCSSVIEGIFKCHPKFLHESQCNKGGYNQVESLLLQLYTHFIPKQKAYCLSRPFRRHKAAFFPGILSVEEEGNFVTVEGRRGTKEGVTKGRQMHQSIDVRRDYLTTGEIL